MKNWFGYGLHLIADTHYEIPVAFHLTPASHSEQVELRAMLDELFEQTPELAERCADFSADRGLDCAETKAKLWDEHHIRPLIDTRELWRSEKQEPNYDPDQPITRPLYPDRADTIVYTEKVTVHCVCLVTGTQRDLAFQGFEADQDTLNYRCPAAAYGLDCQGKAQCHAAGQVNSGDYGRITVNLFSPPLIGNQQHKNFSSSSGNKKPVAYFEPIRAFFALRRHHLWI